jgi:hypothetical protein
MLWCSTKSLEKNVDDYDSLIVKWFMDCDEDYYDIDNGCHSIASHNDASPHSN